MDGQVVRFFGDLKGKYPEFFRGRGVLDVGSRDINGSIRGMFDDCTFIGIDAVDGIGVDIVSLAHEFMPQAKEVFDVVASAEMLEHDPHWRSSLHTMYRLLKRGGLLAYSCASIGYPEHGTAQHLDNGQVYTPLGNPDYYRNLCMLDVKEALPVKLFSNYFGEEKENKLTFWGFKA